MVNFQIAFILGATLTAVLSFSILPTELNKQVDAKQEDKIETSTVPVVKGEVTPDVAQTLESIVEIDTVLGSLLRTILVLDKVKTQVEKLQGQVQEVVAKNEEQTVGPDGSNEVSFNETTTTTSTSTEAPSVISQESPDQTS